MHVLVICKYKKDRIKSNREKVETPFSPLYVSGGFLLPWKPEFWSNLPQNLMQPFPHPSNATHKIWSRLADWLQRYFPHYKSMGAFCCHGNQRFDPICPKTLCSLSLTPMMLHIKYDQDWPPGFRDIQVQKCEIFVTQGQVTPKWDIWFGPNSNATELLCLSWWWSDQKWTR